MKKTNISFLERSQLSPGRAIIVCITILSAFFVLRFLPFSYPSSTAEPSEDPTPKFVPRPTSTMVWTWCAHGLPGSDCSIVSVPLDYANPSLGAIRVGVSRFKARKDHERIGVLFVNAGGPGQTGDAGLEMLNSPEFSHLRDHFDIIGIDPRGVDGRGDRLQCPTALEDPQISLLPNSQNDFNNMAKHNHDVGLGCQQSSGPLIGHVDTRSVVNDMDYVRDALGEKTISYYGVSYGTEIGQLYAEKYPKNLRALALDGNMNHSESGWTVIQQEALAEEQTLNYYQQLCKTDQRCDIPNKDVIAALDKVLSDADNGRLHTTYGIRIPARKVIEYLYNQVLLAPKVTENFEKARLILTENSIALDNSMEPYPISYTIISCQDSAQQSPTFPEFQSWVNDAKKIAPHMYRYTETLTILAACTNWPIPPQNPPAPLHFSDDFSALLVSNKIDPATPLENSVSLHHLIPKSILITTEAVGHTAVANSHCGRVAIAKYLYSAKLPKQDNNCDIPIIPTSSTPSASTSSAPTPQ